MLTWIDAEEYAALRSADLAACLSDEEIERIEIANSETPAHTGLVRWIRNALAGAPAIVESVSAKEAGDVTREADLSAYLG